MTQDQSCAALWDAQSRPGVLLLTDIAWVKTAPCLKSPFREKQRNTANLLVNRNINQTKINTCQLILILSKVIINFSDIGPFQILTLHPHQSACSKYDAHINCQNVYTVDVHDLFVIFIPTAK